MLAFHLCLLMLLAFTAVAPSREARPADLPPIIDARTTDGLNSGTNDRLTSVAVLGSRDRIKASVGETAVTLVSCVQHRCIPPVDVLRYSGWAQWYLLDSIPVSDRLARLQALPPCQRQLPLLVLDEILWGMDGLYGYFLFEQADLAPEIATAMDERGLAPHAKILRDAIALFGTPYPRQALDRRSRYAVFNSEHGIPAAFDIAMRFRSQEFGNLAAYDHVLGASILRERCSTDLVELLRKGMQPHQQLQFLLDRIETDVELTADALVLRQDLAGLPAAHRRLYLASRLTESSSNLLALFRSAEGALAPEIAAALDELGLCNQASVIRAAIGILPAPYPVSTADRRSHLGGVHDPNSPARRIFALNPSIDHGEVLDTLLCYAAETGVLPR